MVEIAPQIHGLESYVVPSRLSPEGSRHASSIGPNDNLSISIPSPAKDCKDGNAMDTSKSIRRYDLDNLRTFLTCLVISHHTSMVYGGGGSWIFTSLCFTSPSDVLLIFNAVNQSFFMGLFFWISGRMSAQMLGRCSPSEFVQRKMLRLGLPTLLYTLLVHPFAWALILPKWDVDSVGQGLFAYWKSIRGVRGPVWYTALLLVFDCVAALIEVPLRSRRIKLKQSLERRRWDVVVYRALSKWGWVAVTVVSFFVRLWYPVGAVLESLNLQPAYLPQYIFAYPLGYLSVQQKADRFTGPFDSAPDTSESTKEKSQPSTQRTPGALSLRFALAISVLTVPACLLPELWARWSVQLYKSSEPTRGGWNLSAAIYALWNEFSLVLLGPALMAHFQRWNNRPATSWLWQARYSYTAYLIHPPLSVAIMLLVDWLLCAGGNGLCTSDMTWWRIFGPFLFTGVVGLVNSAASFALGKFLVTYIPGLRKII
jgi:glucan biosynthesis protein C